MPASSRWHQRHHVLQLFGEQILGNPLGEEKRVYKFANQVPRKEETHDSNITNLVLDAIVVVVLVVIVVARNMKGKERRRWRGRSKRHKYELWSDATKVVFIYIYIGSVCVRERDKNYCAYIKTKRMDQNVFSRALFFLKRFLFRVISFFLQKIQNVYRYWGGLNIFKRKKKTISFILKCRLKKMLAKIELKWYLIIFKMVFLILKIHFFV